MPSNQHLPQISPIQNAPNLPNLCLVAAINQPIPGRAAAEFFETFEVFEKIGLDSFARLDFKGIQNIFSAVHRLLQIIFLKSLRKFIQFMQLIANFV